jgi:general secretion pathway protein N
MSGIRLALLLGAAGFACALLATLPLRWAVAALPDAVECAAPSGSVWHGQCAALRVGTTAIGGTSWQLLASELLRLRLGANVAVVQPGLNVSARVSLRPSGRVVAREVTADLQLGYAFIERVAPNLRGAVNLRADEIVIADGWIRDLRAELRVTDLQQTYPQQLALGGYRIVFGEPPSADGRLVGQLGDTGGPLDVQGSLALLPQRGYELTGTVAARPEASPELASQIRFLGSPDAAGRRAFAQSETF